MIVEDVNSTWRKSKDSCGSRGSYVLVIFLALNVLVVLSFMQFSGSLGFIRRVFLWFLGLFSSYGSHRSPDSFS